MDKLNMTTPDLTARHIDQIAALFPSVVTEMRGENGEIKRGINFEALKQLLSPDVVDGDEHYEFTWVGKRAAMAEAARPTTKTLRPVLEDSRDWDTTENLYIEGDNLEVLKILQESYLGKIKVIYIDPPYNTGKDSFVYQDCHTINSEEYEERIKLRNEDGLQQFRENNTSNSRFHSDWCKMMFSRLILARNLLCNDGVIFISIDEREYANIRKICDDIFGEKNYFGDLVWEATTQPINAGSAKFGLQKKTESILLYGRSKGNIPGFVLEELENNLEYPHVGKYGRCRFEIIEKSDSGDYSRPTMQFPILGQYPRKGKRWQIGETTARELERLGRVEIVDGIVKKAIYPEDEVDKHQYRPFWSLLDSDLVGTAQNGKDELNLLMGRSLGFDTVKPTKLIKKLLSYIGSDYTVLDFFSGSATTAHAAIQLNSEDNGHRNFIMVQISKPFEKEKDAYKAGYKNICEIGKERIRRAGDKIKAENPLGTADLDIGFRVFRVDESNMEDVWYHPEQLTQQMLGGMVSNIKADRTDLDLLYACLLDWGVEIHLPHTSTVVDGHTVHNVDNGALVACFDENVPESVIRAMAEGQPLRAVFRDSSFATDADKINVTEIFKNLSPDTKVKVI